MAEGAERAGGGSKGPPAADVLAPGCLDDDAVVAYAERRLSPAAHASASAHLDTCDDCLALVCAVARSADDTLVSDDAPAPPGGHAEVRPGDALGRYVLLEMVGQGAMGSVYAAHDTQLDRKIALKLVRAERLELPGSRARLSREARAMAKVAHPNVVRVYDAGEARGGVFIAMEFVEGTTLSRWLEAERRPWAEIVGVFLAAGRGLAAAHEGGVVHRDFKPDNVLVDHKGRVAVSDFGLATAQGVALAGHDADALSLAEAATITRTGALLGTPRYMAPEQYAGGRVDAQSDQFSFAVALYEALYGEHPFGGETLGELREAVLRGAVRTPPPGRVPAGLFPSIARALSGDPAARYPSLEALLAALDDASAPPPATVTRRARRATALRLGAAALALASAVAGGALAYRASGRATPPEPGPAASVALGAPVGPAARAGGRTGVVIFDLSPPPTDDPNLPGTLEFVLAATLYPSRRIDSFAGPDVRLLATEAGAAAATLDDRAARALAARDGRPFLLARPSLARRPDGGFELALRVTDPATGRATFDALEASPDVPGLVAAAARLGLGLRTALGDPPSGGPSDRAALSSSLEALHAWRLSRQQTFEGDYVGALESSRRAVAADPQFIEGHAALGLAFRNVDRTAEAAKEFAKALADVQSLGERRRLTLLGDYYSALDRYNEAIAAYEQLLSVWPGDSAVENSLVTASSGAGAWPLTTELVQRTLRDHPRLVIPHTNLITAYLANGKFAEAARAGEVMLAEFERGPSTGYARLASAQVLAGKRADALATLDRLAAFDPEAAGESRADLAFYEGRLDDAEAQLKALIDRIVPAGDVTDARTELIALARLRLRRGDKAGARAATANAAEGLELDGVTPQTRYVVANLLIETSSESRARAIAREPWATASPRARHYAKLIEGDLLLARGRGREAVDAYREALDRAPSWIAHERLGRALLAAHNFDDADRELGWCIEHLGEGANYFVPSLSFLSAPRHLLARAKEGANKPDAADAYRAFLAAEPEAQHDPLVADARRRLAALEGAPPRRR